MKRTTYIIFGMLLAGLVVVCGSIIYTSTQVTGWDNVAMNINGEVKTVELPECKVVKLLAARRIMTKKDDKEVTGIGMVAFVDVPLKVRQAESASGTFTYASEMDEYMTMNQAGDTLRIVFDFPQDKLQEKFKDLYWLNLRSVEMTLALPEGVQTLHADLEAQNVTVEGFNRDSLSLIVRNYAILNDCRFNTLTVQKGAWLFNSGSVDNLHLYLDGIRSWNVNASSFQVDTEYLYAHGNPRCSMEKGECRQVVWIPQSDKASLNIALKQAARVIAE